MESWKIVKTNNTYFQLDIAEGTKFALEEDGLEIWLIFRGIWGHQIFQMLVWVVSSLPLSPFLIREFLFEPATPPPPFKQPCPAMQHAMIPKIGLRRTSILNILLASNWKLDRLSNVRFQKPNFTIHACEILPIAQSNSHESRVYCNGISILLPLISNYEETQALTFFKIANTNKI